MSTRNTLHRFSPERLDSGLQRHAHLDRSIRRGQLALRSELKDRNSRAKLVAGWTGASERTVKNWILGRYAPCGRHLVALAQHSDQVLNAILSMADRQDLLLARKVRDLRQTVFELAAIMERPDVEL